MFQFFLTDSISWQPSMSTPESDRPGIFPLFTDPVGEFKTDIFKTIY